MTIAVGLFDLLTYTIPGALYLGWLAYLAFRLHWLSPTDVGHLPTFLLVVILVLASYLLGYLAYPIGALLNRITPRFRHRHVRTEFLNRNPAARDREFVQADQFLLLGAIQLQDMDVALEVVRLRAAGLMLRNSAPALTLGCVVAFVEIFAGGHPVPAIVAVILLAAGAVALINQGRRMSRYAHMKTLELAYWLPDVDEKTRER